ncbi:RrF2 family transcriptional regulator [Thermodesulfobacterium hydrogeniphilum]|uniref:RrF2 family transcriptional regulator n=1 Tax=Thermodesulfobacterium hydrogeniphilum TaxID=161156 RepID=UPI000570D02A|nr:Rrf2 family transcriptional regulator [Thermodesulfobacterium hydrogeniphilum]
MEITIEEDYAIRTVTYLAKYPERIIPRREISKIMQISKNFLAKIAQKLEKAKIIKIYKGRKGGYKLTKEPEKVTLLKVIEEIKGEIFLNKCLFNSKACHRSSYCSVHKVWKEIKNFFRIILSQSHFKDLAEKGPCFLYISLD